MYAKTSPIAIAAFAAALALNPASGRSADINVVLAVPTTTLTFSSLYIAEDAGFWAKEGLKVSSRVIVGVGSTNAVIAGSADFTVGTGATFLRAAAQGQRLLAIAVLVDRPMAELVLRKDVAEAAGITPGMPLEERAKALKGKTIAIQGVGSIIHAWQRLVARRGGLDPDKDMRIAPMSPPAMFPALISKQIDGYATSLPFTTLAVQKGAAIMLASGPGGDLPEFIPFAYVVLQTRPEVCAKQREKCLRMAHSMKAAVKFIKENKARAFEMLKKRFSRLDPAVLAAAWDVVYDAHPNDVRVTAQGLINAQKFNLDSGLLEEKDAVKDLTSLYTNDFLR